LVVESLPILVTLFLGILRRLTFFLPVYIASSAGLPTGVCVCTGVIMGVTDGVWSMRVLLAVTTVYKISI
jgi:hypothetical protein